MRRTTVNIVLFLLFCVSSIFIFPVFARMNTATIFKEHVTSKSCIDWGQQSLTAESTSTITTKCLIVESCSGAINSITAGGSAPVFICNIPTQTGANRGKIVVNVDVPGGTASGTTVINYMITGYGRL